MTMTTYSFHTMRKYSVTSHSGYKTKAAAEKDREFFLNDGLTETVGAVFQSKSS
jgi:hypothetical protein